MKDDKSIREIIVYTLRMKILLDFAELGSKYWSSGDRMRAESILARYGTEFPREVTPKLYDEIFYRFLKQKEEFVPATRK